jgi:hypothetical protein
MFKNLQSGAQPTTGTSGDSKLRVDVSCFHIIFFDLSKLRNYLFIKIKRIFDGT